ncbi:hypothetical protein RFI_30745 [Reticulomyxa filosa]|uniref:CYRIA/CYRIB Rac1 binding domain-containing protein n=1 Tax=Reticulomyxa filosa TaxID=46433 RepID=X6LZQ3_RETFI|nr:hypothetical protein RFI_30745 [Reticulomyxa filosa]|eukprot:ETO06647.1 hypothetical protein RFI_30745 [Reticulomyxa filosa]
MSVKIEASAKFEAHRFSQKSVPLNDFSKAVHYKQIGETVSNLIDHVAHHHKFADELSNLSEIEECISEADYYIHTLFCFCLFDKTIRHNTNDDRYTYRSYSKPLPMVFVFVLCWSIHTCDVYICRVCGKCKIPAELGDEEKKSLYKQVFEILTPQINKINGLLAYHGRMVKCFTKNLRTLVYPLEKKEPLWRDHMTVLNLLLDRMMILDTLKDMKGQIKNDFSFYKRYDETKHKVQKD